MRCLLVSRTLGPAKNLGRVAVALLERNHEVASVLSKDAGAMIAAPPSLFEGFRPNVVLVSTSSMNIEDELAVVACARARGTPFAVFADTYGTWNRPQFGGELVEACAAVFVPDAVEAEYAKRRGFKNVVPTGVPLWEEYADSRSFPPQGMVRAHLGIPENGIVLMYSADKERALIEEDLRAIFAAVMGVREKKRDRPIYFLPRFHPGDPNLKADPRCYDGALRTCPVEVISSPMFRRAEDLIPEIDVIIQSHGNLGIAAIYQRKSSIQYLTKPHQDRLEKVIGRRTWPPSECGAELLVTDPAELAGAILACLEGRPCGGAQVQHFPCPSPGASAALRIAEALEKLAS